MNQALDFPLPPTTGPYVAEPATTPSAAAPVSAPTPSAAAPVSAPPPSAAAPVSAPPPPEIDELTALRAKVAEQDHVISFAKTRVETLGAEKQEALERALRLEAQLEAAEQREAELLGRIASHESPATVDDQTVDNQTVAELLHRVAALEAIVAPPQAA